MPNEGFRDMRQISQVIHETGKRMLAEKKRSFEIGFKKTDWYSDQSTMRDLGERIKGKDIMSIMCKMNPTFLSYFSAYIVIVVKASQSVTGKDSLTEDELLGQMKCVVYTMSSSLSK